ncbi:hypothetical protein KY290_027887 [Solanum tuberosum]|uniref:Uncharacterized protein n=1 Tax=Solanum tuberosum TaxID=4113 RepID=A0ABQ7UG97_SOLTU|nr:hypothetical protein KY290_027887 [Solanum tuberosum]
MVSSVFALDVLEADKGGTPFVSGDSGAGCRLATGFTVLLRADTVVDDATGVKPYNFGVFHAEKKPLSITVEKPSPDNIITT